MNARGLSTIKNRKIYRVNKITNHPANTGIIPKIMIKKITLLCVVMLVAVSSLFAQDPIVYAGKVVETNPVPVAVDVPVFVENFNDIGAISLTLEFDANVLTYTDFAVNVIGVTFLVNNPLTGVITIAWSSTGSEPPITLNDFDDLLTLEFNKTSAGTSLLVWDVTTQGACDISDAQGSIPASFIDGYVTDVDVSFTSSFTVCETPNYGEIVVTATGGSGVFNYYVDDGTTTLTNQTGLFENLDYGTYEISVTDNAFPTVEIILHPAFLLDVPSVNGYLYNPRTSIYYCYLTDAVNAALDGDLLEFVYPGTFPGLNYNDANRSISFENNSGGEIIIDGTSPALTITAGNLSFDGVTFTTSTDHPTIDISGGMLTLRNCTIIESPGYVQTAIMISDGELDAGNTTTPGQNVFVTSGTPGSAAITQSGTAIANALCNYYGHTTLFEVASLISGDVIFDPWNDATLNNCIYSQQGGPLTYADEKFAAPGTVLVPVYVDRFNTVDAISLTLEFDNTALSITNVTNLHSDLVETPLWGVTGDEFYFTYNANLADPAQEDGITLPPGLVKLFDIEFNTITGTYPLKWINDPTVACEYSNNTIDGPYIDEPTADFYFNGFISDLSGTVVATTDVICKGDDDGTITVTVSGGSGNYTYKIENGTSTTSTDGNFTGVAPGTYTVSIIDADFPHVEYVIPGSYIIDEPTDPLIADAFESYRVRCKGESNGQATINASGGWGGIEYSIDGSVYQTVNYFDALSVGQYTLYAQDAGGCVVTDIVDITEPTIELTSTGVESKVVTCQGGSDGEITLTGYNGWGGYIYSKDASNYHPNPVLTGFNAGTHTVYVKDDGGCVAPVDVTVTEPAQPLDATAAETQPASCFGFSDGEITVYPVGGWGSYEYSIDGGVTYAVYPNDEITGLAAGTYTIYVKDLHGCVVTTAPVTVTEPGMLTGVVSGDQEVCYGEQATFNVTFSGGNPDYIFTFNTPGGTFTNSSTSFSYTKTYTSTTTHELATLTDQNGCPSDISGSATITVNPLPVVTAVDLVTSVDEVTWIPVAGDITGGYEICVDPLIPFHYLDVDDLTLANVPLEISSFIQNAFYLNTTTLPAGFYTYWDNKGVDGTNNAGGWELVMWDIINGTEPMLYISYDGTDHALIDGLQYQTGAGINALRISGDYPQGDYIFSGTVLDENGCTSDPFDISLKMNSSPVVTDVTLLQSIDETNWYPVSGNFNDGFEICVDEVEQFHYLDIDAITYGLNTLLATSFDQNAFYLDVASVPTDFYTYWDNKGVDGTNNAYGWELVMWDIINGNEPMFYISYDGIDYALIDGLQYLVGTVAETLRISGDYPQGTYTFTGTVTDENGCESSPFSIDMTLTTTPQPNAGADIIVCNSTSANLDAVPSAYAGEWTQTAGPGSAIITDPTSPTSLVTVDVAGDYTFTWTETNNICGKSDDVVYTFLKGTLADDYTVSTVSSIDAVSGVPVVMPLGYNLPQPDTDADAHIIMDGLLQITGSNTFPAGSQVIEVRRVAPITTTWFEVVDGDLSGKDHVFLSELLDFSNPLFNNELNDYLWVVTIDGIDGAGIFELDFSLVTYITKPADLAADCYAILDNTSLILEFDDATVDAQDATTCYDPVDQDHNLDFAIEIEYPVIDNVDVNDEILVDAKVSIIAGNTFNAGATLLWGYNAPATNQSAANIVGETELLLSDIVGGVPTPLSGHSGTDVWNIRITGLDAGVYDLKAEAFAIIEVIEPTINPLQIPGFPANPDNIYPAPDQAHYHTYDYFYAEDQFTLTVHPAPEITLVEPDPKVCDYDTEVDFYYSATNNDPDHYSITWDSDALTAGFADVTNAPLPASPIVVSIGSSATVGAYTGELVVINSVTGCVSEVYTITVNVPEPLVTSHSVTDVTCFGLDDGIAAVNATGGWGGYLYLWDDPATQTTDPATGLFAGTYNVLITDTEGCTTNVSVTVNEPDILDAEVAKTDITCNGLTDGEIEITNPSGGHGNYEFSLNTGAWQSSGLFDGLAAGTYTVYIRDADQIHCIIDLGDETIIEPAANVVDGYYVVHNLYNTPMAGVEVELIQGNTTVYDTTTGSDGYYNFPNVCPGTYEVASSTTIEPGGVNATDAVQADIWGVTIPLKPAIERVRFIAGDVYVDGQVDGADASFILEYFVNSGVATAWPAYDWAFAKTNDIVTEQVSTTTPFEHPLPEINITNTSLTQNFFGLPTGDFNRSFVPGSTKSSGHITLNNAGSIVTDNINEFDVPVTVETDLTVSAISLILNYPEDKVDIVDVYLNNDPNTPVMFSTDNGELRIGWNSVYPMILLEGEELITIRVKALSAFTSGESVEFILANDPLNELADGFFDVIPNAELNIATIENTVGVETISISDNVSLVNHPNPFNDHTTFTYNLPENGKVTLEIYDLTGRKVNVLLDENRNAGTHTYLMDDNLLSTGVYIANLKVITSGDTVSKAIRIVKSK